MKTKRRIARVAFKVILVIVTATVLRAWYVGSHVDTHQYGAAELERGPVAQIIQWNEDHTAVQVSQLSTLHADRLWRVVTDQERFDEFMPYVKNTTIRPGPDGSVIETQVLELPHKNFDLELEIRLTGDNNTRTARWRQLRGLLAFNEGAWVVERAGDRSILRYQVSGSLDWIPQWAINYVLRPRLARLLKAVEERVRDLERKEPAYFGRS